MIEKILSGLHFCCPGCESENHGRLKGNLCPECIGKLPFFNQKYRCPGCGSENHGIADICAQCLSEPERPWSDAYAVFAYRGNGRELIRKFKFANHPELARPLGKLASEVIKSSGLEPDLIIPMPLNWLRYLKRSYNQAALLARIIGKECSIPVSTALKRRLSLRQQATLNRKKRHQGLNSAFQIKNGAVAGKHILLVDDVMTTGATLSAAAKILLHDGKAAKVDVLVIARTISFTAGALK